MTVDHISWRMNVIWPEFVKRVLFDHSDSHFEELEHCKIHKIHFSHIHLWISNIGHSVQYGTISSYTQWYANEYPKPETLFTISSPLANANRDLIPWKTPADECCVPSEEHGGEDGYLGAGWLLKAQVVGGQAAGHRHLVLLGSQLGIFQQREPGKAHCAQEQINETLWKNKLLEFKGRQ